MVLSLAEAARLLGKSERQVRYLIRTGKLPAQKTGERWLIRREDLPLSEGQERAATQKAERAARLAVEILQPGGEAKSEKKGYSIRQMRAFQEGAPLYRDLAAQLGAEHPAAELLREALLLFACGFHEFEAGAKAGFYARARQHASRATMTLLLDAADSCDQLVERLETNLLPVLGGLIHQAERRGRRQ
ncbi:MAG: helix-turn-helix domain-containing protein [Thermoanaerobaculia bacterium]|nr:helix-turn-helix domain-containing protein [Thermoanaerobaculia bacterium]